MKNMKVMLRNGECYRFEARRVGFQEGFIFFERDGKTVALFNAADVIYVLENAD